MPQSKHIVVIGSNSIGAGIAQLFAANGHEVALFDRNEAVLHTAIGKIESNLFFLSQNGLEMGKDISSTIERIKLCSKLEEAVTGARFLVETMEEELPVKRALFQELEAYCSPMTVLASNTSKFPLSEIVVSLEVKERIVGTHFWSPPCLIPLVEVTVNTHTLPEVKDYVCNLLLSMDMRPVLINQDVPESLGHRLEQALRLEALSIIDEGIASADDVEEVLKSGVGMRLSALGLLAKGKRPVWEKALSIRRQSALVRQQIALSPENQLESSKNR